MTDAPELTVDDVAAWRAWLGAHESESDGVWLVLAKKGTTSPTTLTYAQALDEALCSGWIDGRKQSRDAATFRQHFTPRRARSMWSARNVDIVARLSEEGRMRPRGADEIARAQADGRWDRAYAGSATIEVPADLQAALDAVPAAARAFAALTKAERYSVLHPVVTATTDAARAARIARHVASLAAEPAEPTERPAPGEY
ncbi:YdeI/OmpD-associated family protein [Microbacterium sp. NPDC089180]|uniref:YdeI/OmpD-associated family protein n=1 Tax=unclassified Microbacterium TaxID=2609290 RepID=UPI003420B195